MKVFGLARLFLLAFLLIATSRLCLPQTPLGFQITPDYAGAFSSPGMDPPLSVRWTVDLGGTASYRARAIAPFTFLVRTRSNSLVEGHSVLSHNSTTLQHPHSASPGLAKYRRDSSSIALLSISTRARR